MFLQVWMIASFSTKQYPGVAVRDGEAPYGADESVF